MNTNTACADVVINLHERGYVHDFAIMGNNIWWIQEHCFLSKEDFTVVECHDITSRSDDSSGRSDDVMASVIFGLVATRYDAKGILIDHRHSRLGLDLKTGKSLTGRRRRIAQQAADPLI